MSKTFDLAELFLIIELIFWDEISMQNRFDIKIVNHILQDVRSNTTFFDRIVICFYDNFRQILSVVKSAELGRLARFTLRAFYF